MALADLIATQGEIAAARITRDFDFSSHDAHERLFAAIKEAVDGAAGFSPAPGKTAPAELVTEEMIAVARRAFEKRSRSLIGGELEAALRAVAPMIAARAEAHAQHIRASAVRRADEHARAEEREACARIAEERSKFICCEGDPMDQSARDEAEDIAAAIRARGNAPERRGE